MDQNYWLENQLVRIKNDQFYQIIPAFSFRFFL